MKMYNKESEVRYDPLERDISLCREKRFFDLVQGPYTNVITLKHHYTRKTRSRKSGAISH